MRVTDADLHNWIYLSINNVVRDCRLHILKVKINQFKRMNIFSTNGGMCFF